MSTIENRNFDSAAEIRHVQEETLSNEHPNRLPPRPNRGRTLGIVGAICLVLLMVLALVQFL